MWEPSVGLGAEGGLEVGLIVWGLIKGGRGSAIILT